MSGEEGRGGISKRSMGEGEGEGAFVVGMGRGFGKRGSTC